MGIALLGTGSWLPGTIVSSADISTEVTGSWIVEKTGIRERRVAAADEATSDLAVKAAERALAAAGLPADQLDVLIVATSTPDQPIPATACLVQGRLGAHRAAAFDVDAVCTGFVYALTVADALLRADPGARTALVIGADTYSRVLDYSDPKTSVLFGDGAGAVVLGKTPGADAILASTLGSDGSQADLVAIPGGGSRRPASAATVAAGEHYFRMRGGPVRRLANRVVPEVIEDLLKAADLPLDAVDLLIPHQANGRMLDDWERDLRLRPGVLHRTVERYGNTGAASIPITLDDAVRDGRAGAGSIVLLVGFGGGMTWGGAVLRGTEAA